MTFINRPCLGIGLAALALGSTAGAALAQGSLADYARATSLREKYERAALDIAGPPTAVGQTHRFWYRKSVKGGDEFVVVDADTQQKQPAFDHERIAQALSRSTGESYTPLRLPFNTVAFSDDGSAFTATVAGSPYRCTIVDSICRKADPGPRVGAGLNVGRRNRDEGPRLSPDGNWQALINNYNLVIKPAHGGTLIRLSTDGSEGNAVRAVLDRVVARLEENRRYRVQPGYRREVHYVESSPEDQLQPKSLDAHLRQAGRCARLDQPVLFDVAAKREMVDRQRAVSESPTRCPSSSGARTAAPFTFEYNQRGHQFYRVIEVDAATGKARAVIDRASRRRSSTTGRERTLADSGKQYPLRHRRRQRDRLDVGARRLEPPLSLSMASPAQ